MAFLKDDMAVELIRESGGRTLNGRILRSGRLAVEYSLLFQACVVVLPPLSTIFNLKGSPRVILKKSDGSRIALWLSLHIVVLQGLPVPGVGGVAGQQPGHRVAAPAHLRQQRHAGPPRPVRSLQQEIGIR